MENLVLKIVLLGSSGGEKSKLLDKYIGNKSSKLYPINGIDIKDKSLIMEDGNKVLVKFFNIVGFERYHSIACNYLRNSDGAAIFYDVTNSESFENIEFFYKNSRKTDIPIILIACKCDLEGDGERKISKEKAEKYANERNIPYIETSSKDNINTTEAIKKIVDDAYRYLISKIKDKKIKTKFNKLNKFLNV